LFKRTETEKETHKIKIKEEIDRDQGRLTNIILLHMSDQKVELSDMEQREEIFQIETIQSLMATRHHTMEMSQDQLCSPKKPSMLVAVIEK
jgi:hypothetical protein